MYLAMSGSYCPHVRQGLTTCHTFHTACLLQNEEGENGEEGDDDDEANATQHDEDDHDGPSKLKKHGSIYASQEGSNDGSSSDDDYDLIQGEDGAVSPDELSDNDSLQGVPLRSNDRAVDPLVREHWRCHDNDRTSQ